MTKIMLNIAAAYTFVLMLFFLALAVAFILPVLAYGLYSFTNFEWLANFLGWLQIAAQEMAMTPFHLYFWLVVGFVVSSSLAGGAAGWLAMLLNRLERVT